MINFLIKKSNWKNEFLMKIFRNKWNFFLKKMWKRKNSKNFENSWIWKIQMKILKNIKIRKLENSKNNKKKVILE